LEIKIVLHFKDGKIEKGTTTDFSPRYPSFHILNLQGISHQVDISKLKAIFFVRDFGGKMYKVEKKVFPSKRLPGKKVQVKFTDSEVLLGYTQGYDPRRTGFFLLPVDPESNNERIFVVLSSVEYIQILD
jgi:hypothetical protein